jgi:hypothetical protein
MFLMRNCNKRFPAPTWLGRFSMALLPELERRFEKGQMPKSD